MVHVQVFLLSGIIAFNLFGIAEAADPCNSYNVLAGESRSVLKTSYSTTTDILTGWYRFMGKAGDKMLDYDPKYQNYAPYRCAAQAQGYLYGSHPRGSAGITTKSVCFRISGYSCWKSVSIKVKNCGNYFVYELASLNSLSATFSTSFRYCGAGEVENNYPCKHYQLLTENNRSETYRTSKNEYCDQSMKGWYRFWGEAGHRMLDHCPVRGQMLFICGAYNQGWLNETNPVPLDGNVNRTMCFSDFTDNACKCNPKLETQIHMRHCGDYIVYNLKSIDKCSRKNNARYCGMKDKDAHNVTCSANYMQIDLDRRYYNSSTYKSIRLRSPKCGHTLSYDYITLGSIPSACDSIKQETKTEIVYINAVKLTARFGKGLVSREHDETIYFKCIYRRDAVIDKGASFAPVGEVKVELEKFGNFSFHINTYKKNSYAERIDEFPVKLKLRDWLYFEVNATVKDSSLSLLIEQCYSTPTMDPEQPLKYYLIEDRCAVDITTQFIPATGLRRRFSMQAFRYENSTSVYIHCLVFLCRKTSTDERCSTGCFGNKIRRKRRDIASESLTDAGSSSHTGYYKLDSGKIILDKSDDSKHVRPKKGGSDKTTPTATILFGVMGVVTAVLAAVVVMLLLRRKHSPEAKVSFKKEIGIVNAVEVT